MNRTRRILTRGWLSSASSLAGTLSALTFGYYPAQIPPVAGVPITTIKFAFVHRDMAFALAPLTITFAFAQRGMGFSFGRRSMGFALAQRSAAFELKQRTIDFEFLGNEPG